jgi:hypothetical protein
LETYSLVEGNSARTNPLSGFTLKADNIYPELRENAAMVGKSVRKWAALLDIASYLTPVGVLGVHWSPKAGQQAGG